jgi:cell division protein FtsW
MITKEVISAKIKGLFRGDKVIWMVVVFLALISMLVVYTSSDSLAYRAYHDNNTKVLMQHLIMLGIGLVALLVAANIRYRRYAKIMPLLFWVSIPLLLYTLLFGQNLNNASRVISLGIVTFQTSDLAKVALIGMLARILTLYRDRLGNLKDLFWLVMVPVLVVVGLIFRENFSTAAMLFATCIVMMFLGKIKMKYIFGFVGTIVVVGAIAVFVLLKVMQNNPEKMNRSMTWVNRIERFVGKEEEDPEKNEEKNFQITQSKIAIAGGGIFGKMPGKSTQRTILPHPYSDFIYAIIIEEYGLVGGVFVLLLYLILLYRATRLMIRAPQSFGAMLAFGLAFSIVMQALVNMGVAVGLLPVTGQPMPFVSRGGTSLAFTGLALGIIISVTREINFKETYLDDGNNSEVELTEADS